MGQLQSYDREMMLLACLPMEQNKQVLAGVPGTASDISGDHLTLQENMAILKPSQNEGLPLPLMTFKIL